MQLRDIWIGAFLQRVDAKKFPRLEDFMGEKKKPKTWEQQFADFTRNFGSRIKHGALH
jgi:hypothetical protein